jgi:hypothetical protein
LERPLPQLPAVIGSTAISLIGQFKVDYAIIGASRFRLS